MEKESRAAIKIGIRQIKPTQVGVMKDRVPGKTILWEIVKRWRRLPTEPEHEGVAAGPEKGKPSTTRWLEKCFPPLACKLKMVYAFKLAPGQVDNGMTGPQQDNIIIHERPKVENAVMSPRAPEKPTTREWKHKQMAAKDAKDAAESEKESQNENENRTRRYMHHNSRKCSRKDAQGFSSGKVRARHFKAARSPSGVLCKYEKFGKPKKFTREDTFTSHFFPQC